MWLSYFFAVFRVSMEKDEHDITPATSVVACLARLLLSVAKILSTDARYKTKILDACDKLAGATQQERCLTVA